MSSEIVKVHEDLKAGKISCVQLIQERLKALKNSSNNTANYLLTEFAMERASKVDEKIKNGEEIGLFEGIPFGIKDVYLLQGQYASASSDFLRNYKSPYTATAIQKLLDAGAIPIVKENCDSFGHGSSTENTVFGASKNALNEELVAGGSSGGSAVNVAKGYTVFSIGGDTGGSIRQPAGYNKVYGLKPTYGRISRYGLMAYASSTDCVGPISKSLEDILLLLNVMSGKDYHDQTSFESEQISLGVIEKQIRGNEFKIGYYKNFIENKALDPELKKDFIKFIETLKSNGVEVKELDFFDGNILVSTYYMLAMAETASNLARLDGTNYGVRHSSDSLKEGYAITRSENFTEETKRRIVGGNQVLSHGHAEEIYLKARTLREQIKEQFDKEFTEVDIILSPVSTGKPPKIGETLKDPLAMYLSDAYTVGFSLGGLPTLTSPLVTETGIQITSAKGQEEKILKFAKYIKDIVE
ncbi:MAG: Asp-tRNA(Asn)/Glu-tRNA(Gln) amidotransferase subunit GatA [Marinilabiliaceae bacterium]|nr:Asp-tRNA(Asn)/Glu-tRNA(Gln) amidotransferase subunit GatA [Marinilabiliaceae bacterium]